MGRRRTRYIRHRARRTRVGRGKRRRRRRVSRRWRGGRGALPPESVGRTRQLIARSAKRPRAPRVGQPSTSQSSTYGMTCVEPIPDTPGSYKVLAENGIRKHLGDLGGDNL